MEEMKTLLINIQKCLPKNDQYKYSTTLEKSINWEQVKFDNRDSKECKECALSIMKRVNFVIFLLILVFLICF